MPKIRLEIEETLTYIRFIDVKFDDSWDDETINNILDKAESRVFDMGGLENNLERQGVEIIESADYDLSSPNDVELKIMGYEEIKGGK